MKWSHDQAQMSLSQGPEFMNPQSWEVLPCTAGGGQ